ncbi:hypothetical protein L6R52_12430 [Myxococcota bacterium]|nr:hypothetical protein [Myxococcota bacterium]
MSFDENTSAKGDAEHAALSCDKPGCTVVLERVRFGSARGAAVELGQGDRAPKLVTRDMKWPP